MFYKGTLLPIKVIIMGTEDEDLTMYSCGIWSNPEHCLSFENLSSGFLMVWEVPLSRFMLILWTHLGYYMMFLGRLGFFFSQFLVLLIKDFKNSLRRKLTYNSIGVWEKKTPPPRLQARENPGSHQEERWRQCHVFWVRHGSQRHHAEGAGCLGKHAPWLVLAKNLESKFKGHLIPVQGQKVVSEARDENKEWVLRNRMQS